MVGPSVIDNELDDTEEGAAGNSEEKVGFVRFGVGISICVAVEVVSNVENTPPAIRVTNAIMSMINLQRERFIGVPHQTPEADSK